MFTRRSTFIFSSIEKFGVRFSAQSKKKRITVQLLKDFPEFGVKGQIVQVKPSIMMNKLHRNNGACYILPGQGPRIPVVEPKEEVKTVEDELAAKELAKPQPTPKAKAKLFSLDELVSININELLGTSLEVLAAKIPKKIVFLNDAEEDGSLKKPINNERLISTLGSLIKKELKEDESIGNFFKETTLNVSNQHGSYKTIEKTGKYRLTINDLNAKELFQTIIEVDTKK
ncbi:unnamed protein product [[Candida] boidinii]|uniref:Unnamed protein product n=1 Tax=Candida boidinii TaxID=5477 RepID=A0A9W6T5I1_CANBO|nr:hypothetical protein BVG19_g2541 [[Candida] boidinii]OWB50492.1 hypothetical protein B5S27_g2042 [[Candida] boidinii]OWB66004.1 hypothetical protein B5S30_g1338 [[Candida] boidinii]GME75610.1 unnamed protein product [[Candida] boidinii]GMF99886.1 unnamed protein product [[Candida] boidinii]